MTQLEEFKTDSSLRAMMIKESEERSIKGQLITGICGAILAMVLEPILSFQINTKSFINIAPAVKVFKTKDASRCSGSLQTLFDCRT